MTVDDWDREFFKHQNRLMSTGCTWAVATATARKNMERVYGPRPQGLPGEKSTRPGFFSFLKLGLKLWSLRHMLFNFSIGALKNAVKAFFSGAVVQLGIAGADGAITASEWTGVIMAGIVTAVALLKNPVKVP